MTNNSYNRGRRVTAVLGPTNTGKTHLAVERMFAHESGMIGLPLRLLAREVYDRVVEWRGPSSVALITGEEKIVPDSPRYYVCTVEAMPADKDVDFVAIDEVQLAADPDRGHIFTDRLLHMRGQTETMVLGASTIKPIIERLLPGANFVSRPRFSNLSYAGQKKITRLPRRSAIVAFSADSVYAIAELIRRQRGGAAVVLGALSPRTRNAQVALYQSGDVDFLVATDAIGMGLNMDVDHVAFAATRKFDGMNFRDLNPGELAQIAGRAGRHMNDGTFGVTADAVPMDPEVVNRIENHQFESLKVVHWRNREVDYSSLDNLMTSLIRPPSEGGLVRARIADDVTALEILSRDDDIRALAGTPATVERLWDVCQIPDYRNITGGEHANMIGRIFNHVMTGDGFIPADWFAGQLAYADRTDGDIDTLATRIAHIRTWTFVANRSTWLKDPAGWQEKTRAIEDKLSDALHERLSQRFVDRRTSVLMKRLREKEDLMASVSGQGEIHVEGEMVGNLVGFRFVPDAETADAQPKAMKAAALKVIATELANRAGQFRAAPDTEMTLNAQGQVEWKGETVASLATGEEVLRPKLLLSADEQLTGTARDTVQERLDNWTRVHIDTLLEPLAGLAAAEGIDGLARGLAFRLVENLGVLVRDDVSDDVKQLDQDARRALRKYGVRFGAFHIFVPSLLKPAPARLRLLLWGLSLTGDRAIEPENLPSLPPDGLTSVPFDRSTPRGFYQAAGYRLCGARAVRIDMLERLGDLIRTRVFWKPEKETDERPEGSVDGGGFTVIPDMMSLVGCSGEDFASILQTLGFRVDRRKAPVPAPADGPAAPDSARTSESPSSEGAVVDQSTTAAITDQDVATEVVPSGDDDQPAPTGGSGEPVEGPPSNEDSVVVATETGPVAGDSGEPAFIEVWKPRRKKRPEHRKPKPEQKSESGHKASGKPRQQRRSERKGKPQKSNAVRLSASPKKQASLEDSPFAALSALKKAMEEGSDRKT